MSTLKKTINYKMLENELDEAIRADELYKLQNDAKIRAMEQRVPTYDHFRDMVQAAHLRPLERHEMQKKAEVSWNHCVNGKGSDIDRLSARDLKLRDDGDGKSGKLFEPQNSVDFLKIWRTLDGTEVKFDYLLRYRDKLKDKFFKIEIPTEFLEEFFVLSLEINSPDTLADIVDILTIFSQCNRFLLSLTMIAKTAKANLQVLFEKLSSLASEEEEKRVAEMSKLMKCYGVLV